MIEFELRFTGGPADGQIRVIPRQGGQHFPASIMEFRELVSERDGLVYERLYRYQRCRVRVASSRAPWRYEYEGSEIGTRVAG